LPRPTSWVCRPPRLARLDRYSQVTFLAAHEAFRAANLQEKPVAPEALGMVLGTAYGCHAVNEEYYAGMVREGVRAASPRLFTATLPSAPTGEMAIAFQAKGPALTLAHGWDAGLAAVAWAGRLCSGGKAKAVLAGGADILSDVLLTLLDEWALGIEPSEGAAFVVVEAAHEARERGATVRAMLLGTGAAFSPRPSGRDALERAITAALRDAGLTAAAVRHAVVAQAPRSTDSQGRAHGRFGALPVDPASLYGTTFGAGGVLGIGMALEALQGPTIVAAEDPLGSASALVLGPA